MEQKYVKVQIYPLVRYLTPPEREGFVAPMKPEVFAYDRKIIKIHKVAMCERAVSRKAGGRGYRFTCYINWKTKRGEMTQQSILWYDDFLEEWFVEVPEGSEPKDWDVASQIAFLEEHLSSHMNDYCD